jgi:hypothetical protein
VNPNVQKKGSKKLALIQIRFHHLYLIICCSFYSDVIFAQGQHSLDSSLLSCCLKALVCITSIRDIRGEFGEIPLLLECLSASWMANMAGPWFAHGQHCCDSCNNDALPKLEAESHFGFSHAN